jgi:DNA-binding NtrC family response regulator
VLQERSFERLGGNETLRIEARLIALTNVDLPAAVAAGRFREDLYFRLNVLTLHVPALRQRRADVLPLSEHLLAGLRSVHGRGSAPLSDATRHMLAAYDWPGNVRELRNALEHAVVFSSHNALVPKDFPENVRAAAGGAAVASELRTLKEIEKEVVAATLEATHYHISNAAKALGISRKTLLEKRKRYGLK